MANEVYKANLKSMKMTVDQVTQLPTVKEKLLI